MMRPGAAFALGLIAGFLTQAGLAEEGMAGREVGPADTLRVLFEDPMTGDWQENWFLDGKEATLRNDEQGLFFAGGTITKQHDVEKYHAHHAVLWTKREFSGDIRIAFEMTRKDDGGGATLLYIQARGVGTPPYVQDIREWNKLREIPAMSTYYTFMDLLSISFREDLRLRRYPWTDKDGNPYPENGLVEPKLNYRQMAPGDSYRVVVDKRNPRLTLRLYAIYDGKSAHKPEVEHTWDMTKASAGRDPEWIHEGRIGIRHMATRQLVYRNFKVEQLDANVGPASGSSLSTTDALPLVFEDDFSAGIDHWEPTDPDAWTLRADGGRTVWGINKRRSDYHPKVRSPLNIGLVKDLELSDTVIRFRVKSTLDTGSHRDCCVFFNWRDAEHFYYVHLGAKPDSASGQIMIVDGEDRRPLTNNTKPVPWDDAWHTVKLIRDVESGRIAVYFDDLDRPLMEAFDKTFSAGRVGIGSFDDMDDFTDVSIFGRRVKPERR